MPISITLTFDNPTVEKDFFNTLSAQNFQAVISELGLENTPEDIALITDDDRKAFVLKNLERQLADGLESEKLRQAVATLQKQRQSQPRAITVDPLPAKKK